MPTSDRVRAYREGAPKSDSSESEPLEDFRTFKVRPDILLAMQVFGSLVWLGIVAAFGLWLSIEFIQWAAS